MLKHTDSLNVSKDYTEVIHERKECWFIATLARVHRTMVRQELKQDSDSTAILRRKRFQRDTTTLAIPRAHHQQGEDPGWVGRRRRADKGRPNTKKWGKSENELELNQREYSKLSTRFVVGDQRRQGKGNIQFLFPKQNGLDCFQFNIWHLQSNGRHRNIDKEERRGED